MKSSSSRFASISAGGPSVSFVTAGEVNLKCYEHPTKEDFDNYNNLLSQKTILNTKNRTTSYLLNRVAIAWCMNQPILIQGPTGCGKTSIVHYLCQLCILRLNVSQQFALMGSTNLL